MRHLRTMFAIFLLAASCTTAMYAQAVSATLVGTLTDSSGGVIVNAKVTATETNTGVVRTGNTNESGNYTFTNVPPGVYSVAAEQPGFKKVTRANIAVAVDTTTRVDLTLTPGQVTETVDVTAEAPILQTDRADIGRKIETVQLANLPV